jgi:CheY-like chemotaxis protein
VKNKGTTVLVCLPLTHQEETEAKTVNRKDMSLLGVKVLVVDDEEQNLNYMKSLLEYYGAEVNSFSSAPEVLNQIDSIRNTDVAIVDYIMPEMNGAQLVAELKEYMPNLAMLMVSGICSQVELDALRENGTYLISKPFHSEDFISAVQDIAQKS